jgi:hypothetical protein
LNSSAVEPIFESYVRRSLTILKREQPRMYAELRRAFADSAVDASVSGERVHIYGRGDEILVEKINGDATSSSIRATSTLEIIERILEGEQSLLDVVWRDQVHLVGSLERLLVVHAALVLYLQAAVRCPSIPRLLNQFRRRVQQHARARYEPPTRCVA